ncbi:DUF4301 family protein [Deltaproteobacteria bacterium IMCC39524]|nr:DUF4301 family protein [Deltaproteobacteria bacterium IMCC39524]
MNFSTEDLQQLEALEIEPSKAARQLAWLRSGQLDITLERCCTVDDGITQLQPESHAYLYKAFDSAIAAGRLRRFVPASGAASRMFSPLHAERAVFDACRAVEPLTGASQAELNLRRFLDKIEAFAFYPDLNNAMAEDDQDLQQALADRDLPLIVRYLLEPCGLSYSRLPKGLLAFHAAVDGSRTPFIEHLAEAALLNGLDGVVRLHFTVSAEHLELFKAQFAAWQETLAAAYGCHFEVSYSTQKASTDTLALDAKDQPLRDSEDRLVLRPGGHGALIKNLNDLSGDIVLIRNIDNVVPDVHKDANLTWAKLLTGYLVTLQEEQHALLKALHDHPEDPMARELAVCFLGDRLQLDVSLSDDTQSLLDKLDRPVRVCGMVPNSGEPGGGPFWVRGSDGRVTRQIVEGAQIDKSDPEQAKILAGSTHFNPVDMVCGVSDWRGRPYDLNRFVDEDAVIITSKRMEGQELKVLELPGLWNGAMAGWHTLFVEIPPEAFNPVKTVFDLLRPAHQA